MLLSVALAACAAAANALASVLQRKAAREAPEQRAAGLRLLVAELHRPAFLGGIGGLTAGFLLQAAALSQGALSVVQPVLACELPLTLLLAGLVFHRRLGRREWFAAAIMAAGLAGALIAAEPTPGDPLRPSGLTWAVAIGSSLVALGLLAVAGFRSSGLRRAALLGTTAGGLFAVTAAFMTAVTAQAQHGLGRLFGSWQVYAMVAAGAAAVYMLQPAFRAGLLAAAQPGVTLADPLLAVLLGVVLFGERLRFGWWGVLEVAGIAAIAGGVLLMARSPLLHEEQDRADDGDRSGGDRRPERRHAA